MPSASAGDLRRQGVDAGGLQPEPAPLVQVAAAGLLEFGHEVAELGVLPGVLAEVLAHAGHELLRAHPGHELAQHRGALGVGDAVEVHLDVLEVVDLGEDRVRGGQLVLPVGPGLLHGGERGPGVVELGVLHGGQVGHVLGEGLVEPEVVPPAHGHEVAEPHVRELVQHGDGAAFHLGVGDLAAEDVAFQDGDGPGVFHGAGVELRARRAGRTSRTGTGSRTGPRRTRSPAG